MEDELAAEYDVVIIGTGMPECILAAAVARVGKTVLHMDRNEFYGGDWATFNFEGLQKWIAQKKVTEQCPGPGQQEFNSFVQTGEKCIPVIGQPFTVTNLQETTYIKDRPQDISILDVPSIVLQGNGDQEVKPEESSSNKEVSSSTSENSNVDNEGEEKELPSEDNQPVGGDSQAQSKTPDKITCTRRKEITMEDIKTQWRLFNIDIAPKVLFSRGALVELLISSNIARYAEFKCVTRVLTLLNGKLEQVPCSRSDVFSTKDVTIVEKRMLMKLLTFCMDYEQHPEEYQGFENKTFVEFLRARKLTRNVQHYVLHAIAMGTEKTSTLEGLEATQRFLRSLGRYGNTPFLWPMYGSGELPQCFCRLCAVFGGVYYLKRCADAIIANEHGQCIAIVSQNKRISCKWLVMESSYISPDTFDVEISKKRKVSRGIFLTDRSVLNSEKEQLTLLRLPPTGDLQTAVTVIELGPSAMACPDGMYMVHLTCDQITTAENDLRPAADILFVSPDIAKSEGRRSRPKMLWSVYFNFVETARQLLQEHCPGNVVITSGPGSDMEFDNVVYEAKELFYQMYPDEEFLPRAPDPEEMVLDEPEGSNPGPAFEADAPQDVGKIDGLVDVLVECGEADESGNSETIQSSEVMEKPSVDVQSASEDCQEVEKLKIEIETVDDNSREAKETEADERMVTDSSAIVESLHVEGSALAEPTESTEQQQNVEKEAKKKVRVSVRFEDDQ